ncbi:MAG: hypothetical protein DMD91_17825 [Candidatus Rokuibacteriota bacterium]|nr:MAG: hypothetical protein DMD91_17825 [Candidatus Rokubacteria bacterium]
MAARTIPLFRDAEYVVVPSGSCAWMVKQEYPGLMHDPVLKVDAERLAARTFELSQFLVKVLGDAHVAVFDRETLVESLEQLGVFFEAWHAEAPEPGRGAAMHVITGPSRTADIELTLTRGVHGPKEVHAVFVDTPIRG